MIKFISKRISLLLLAAMLGLTLFAVSRHATAQGGFQYMCDAWEESCDDGSGDFGGGSSGGGGGVKPYCAVPEAGINGGRICKADGCRLAPNYPNTYVCDYKYQKADGTYSSDGCPPLEQCE